MGRYAKKKKDEAPAPDTDSDGGGLSHSAAVKGKSDRMKKAETQKRKAAVVDFIRPSKVPAKRVRTANIKDMLKTQLQKSKQVRI